MRLALILAVLLSLPAASSQIPDPRVDQIFANYQKPNSPGCALGVIQDGRFIYQASYGLANLELNAPISSQSVFYVGSIAKQFTAASIVLASEQGFLSLDDDVHKYIPEIPDFGKPVTPRQMLHHMSGFPDILTLLAISGRNAADLHPEGELLNLVVKQKSLNFNPGDEYQYSNTNYLLVAEVLKRATHKSLAQFADENIFKPLGMAHTRFYDDHTAVVPGRVSAYRPGKDAFLVDWSTNYDNVGGGGLMTTVGDLLLWDRNFYDNKLGKGTLVKELQTPGIYNDGKPSNYALGLTMTSYRGLPLVEHDGALFGYRAALLRFPKQHFTVICLCNVSTADPDKLSRAVADVYLKKEEQPRVEPSNVDPSPYVGTYHDARMHYSVPFVGRDNNLMLQGDALRQIGPNEFEDPVVGGVATFSNPGQVKRVIVTYNNRVTFDGTEIGDLHVEPSTLSAFAGTYTSIALDAKYEISVEQQGLALRMNWGPTIKLKPVVPDEFSSGEMSLVFRRDSNNRISGLSVFEGWGGVIRDEKFNKLP